MPLKSILPFPLHPNRHGVPLPRGTGGRYLIEISYIFDVNRKPRPSLVALPPQYSILEPPRYLVFAKRAVQPAYSEGPKGLNERSGPHIAVPIMHRNYSRR